MDRSEQTEGVITVVKSFRVYPEEKREEGVELEK